jgi:hypothetical protein
MQLASTPEYDESRAPVMLFNPNTGTCQLYADVFFYPFVSSPPAFEQPYAIFMNNALYNFFGNFPSALYLGDNNPNHCDYQIIGATNDVAFILNGNTNASISPNLIPSGYYRVDQEYSSVYLWYSVTSISFISNGLGVIPEYIPPVNDTDNVVSDGAGAGNNAQLILTDFVPNYAPGDVSGPNSYLYYAVAGEWRFSCLTVDEIRNMDLTIRLRTRIGQDLPYYLPPYQSATIKVAFVKATTKGRKRKLE